MPVELSGISAKSDVVRRIGVVGKGQLEAKLLDVEPDCALDVSRTENRVSFLNIGDPKDQSASPALSACGAATEKPGRDCLARRSA
jgi:hypothetical protein